MKPLYDIVGLAVIILGGFCIVAGAIFPYIYLVYWLANWVTS